MNFQIIISFLLFGITFGAVVRQGSNSVSENVGNSLNSNFNGWVDTDEELDAVSCEPVPTLDFNGLNGTYEMQSDQPQVPQPQTSQVQTTPSPVIQSNVSVNTTELAASVPSNVTATVPKKKKVRTHCMNTMAQQTTPVPLPIERTNTTSA